jgi:hypothetical protein
VLGVDRAVVVTTDNRHETRDFGATHDVTVLHGDFQQRVINTFSNTSDRITEEQLFSVLKTPCVVDSAVVWPRFFRDSKAALLDGLSFNGCNALLIQIRLLLAEYLASNKTSLASVRLLYVITAYFLIALDYSARLIVHLDADKRRASLAEGFRYGDSGRERTEKIVDMAVQLLAVTAQTDLVSRATLGNEVTKQLSDYPAEILAEHFAKSEVLKQLFDHAREFERSAYAVQLAPPHQIASEQKALVGLLCDFLKIDRRQVI